MSAAELKVPGHARVLLSGICVYAVRLKRSPIGALGGDGLISLCFYNVDLEPNIQHPIFRSYRTIEIVIICLPKCNLAVMQ